MVGEEERKAADNIKAPAVRAALGTLKIHLYGCRNLKVCMCIIYKTIVILSL